MPLARSIIPRRRGKKLAEEEKKLLRVVRRFKKGREGIFAFQLRQAISISRACESLVQGWRPIKMPSPLVLEPAFWSGFSDALKREEVEGNDDLFFPLLKSKQHSSGFIQILSFLDAHFSRLLRI